MLPLISKLGKSHGDLAKHPGLSGIKVVRIYLVLFPAFGHEGMDCMGQLLVSPLLCRFARC